jgi:PAP2 superfamily
MRTRPAALFLIPSPTSADVGRPATSRRPSASGRAGTRAASLARFAALELAIWAAVYGTYLVVRGLTIGAPAAAFDHAWEVVDLERALGIFHEPAVQQLLGPLAAVFAFYYMAGFGPLLGLVIVWLALRHPESYRGLRNALLLSIALATVVFVAVSDGAAAARGRARDRGHGRALEPRHRLVPRDPLQPVRSGPEHARRLGSPGRHLRVSGRAREAAPCLLLPAPGADGDGGDRNRQPLLPRRGRWGRRRVSRARAAASRRPSPGLAPARARPPASCASDAQAREEGGGRMIPVARGRLEG